MGEALARMPGHQPRLHLVVPVPRRRAKAAGPETLRLHFGSALPSSRPHPLKIQLAQESFRAIQEADRRLARLRQTIGQTQIYSATLHDTVATLCSGTRRLARRSS